MHNRHNHASTFQLAFWLIIDRDRLEFTRVSFLFEHWIRITKSLYTPSSALYCHRMYSHELHQISIDWEIPIKYTVLYTYCTSKRSTLMNCSVLPSVLRCCGEFFYNTLLDFFSAACRHCVNWLRWTHSIHRWNALLRSPHVSSLLSSSFLLSNLLYSLRLVAEINCS